MPQAYRASLALLIGGDNASPRLELAWIRPCMSCSRTGLEIVDGMIAMSERDLRGSRSRRSRALSAVTAKQDRLQTI